MNYHYECDFGTIGLGEDPLTKKACQTTTRETMKENPDCDCGKLIPVTVREYTHPEINRRYEKAIDTLAELAWENGIKLKSVKLETETEELPEHIKELNRQTEEVMRSKGLLKKDGWKP